MKTMIAILAFALAPAPLAAAQEISAKADRPTTKGPAETFTGSVAVSPMFSATAQRPYAAAEVTFSAGARSAWHTHPAGQTLVVTSGLGWVQVEGQPKREIKPGDVIWTPPGVKHWHGATAASDITHIATQGSVDGKTVDWKEKVTDEQYLAPPAR